MLIFVQTVKDYHAFSVQFELPDLRDNYDSKPTSFLAHFLGHEGRGSICAYLKRRGWLLDLSAGDSGEPRAVHLFKIEGTLTLEGYREQPIHLQADVRVQTLNTRYSPLRVGTQSRFRLYLSPLSVFPIGAIPLRRGVDNGSNALHFQGESTATYVRHHSCELVHGAVPTGVAHQRSFPVSQVRRKHRSTATRGVCPRACKGPLDGEEPFQGSDRQRPSVVNREVVRHAVHRAQARRCSPETRELVAHGDRQMRSSFV